MDCRRFATSLSLLFALGCMDWSAPTSIAERPVLNPELDCTVHSDTRIRNAPDRPLRGGEQVTVDFCLTEAVLESAIGVELVQKWYYGGIAAGGLPIQYHQDYIDAVWDGGLEDLVPYGNPSYGMKPYAIDLESLVDGYGSMTVTLPSGTNGTTQFDLSEEYQEFACCRNSFRWLVPGMTRYAIESEYALRMEDLVFVDRALSSEEIFSSDLNQLEPNTAGVVMTNQPVVVSSGAHYWLVDFTNVGWAWVAETALEKAVKFEVTDFAYESDGLVAGAASRCWFTLGNRGDVVENPPFPNLGYHPNTILDQVRVHFSGHASVATIDAPPIPPGMQRTLSIHTQLGDQEHFPESYYSFSIQKPFEMIGGVIDVRRVGTPYVDPDDNPWTDPHAGMDQDWVMAGGSFVSMGGHTGAQIGIFCNVPEDTYSWMDSGYAFLHRGHPCE